MPGSGRARAPVMRTTHVPQWSYTLLWPAFPVVQFIESAHPEIKFAQHSLRAALKMGVEKGKLVMVKASYKLSPEEKKPPKKKKVRCAFTPDHVHRVSLPPQ